ncbi:MAG: MBG domain-containing protein, partial [Acidobacteria bacterium]|nr:MBG domain-containing protein [Acidobacteriota bacterium]
TITNAGADFTINPKVASVTPTVAGKTYGDVDPALTGTLSDFLAADNVTAVYARTAGETVAGSSYTINATLNPSGALGNYSITYNTAAFTIAKRLAAWTTNASGKTYGDADPAPLTTGSGSNFTAADNVTATYGRASGETVTGGPYPITATLSPAGVLSNYTITNAGADFTINPKVASVTPTVAGKTYGDVGKTYGDVDPALTGTLSGFLAADNVTAAYARTAGEAVAGSPYTISATLSPAGVLSNYTITNAGAAFTINKLAATWTTSPNSKTYGTADPSPLTTGSGTFLTADNISATYTRAPGNTVAGGPYLITATLVDPNGKLVNYEPVTNIGASFTISPANTTTTAPSINAHFGDPLVTLTANVKAGLPSTATVNEGSVTFVVTTTSGTVLATLGPVTVAAGAASASVTLGSSFVAGHYNVAVTYNPASVAPNFSAGGTTSGLTIDPAQTTLVITKPADTQYSDPVKLAATVSPTILNGQTISGSVEFFIAGVSVGSAAVNNAGVATKSGISNMRVPANYAVTAAFTSTNSNFTDSSGVGVVLTVTPEDARAVSTGLTSLSTPSTSTSNVSAKLMATVQDITGILLDPAYDGDLGDTRNARVTFVNRNQSNAPFPGCSDLTPTLIAPADLKTGVVSCVTTLTTGSADSATYEVGIVVTGYYTRNDSYDDFDVNVYKPGTGFLGGGGYLINTASVGVYAGTAGTRTNFGFNAKAKTPKVLQGHVNIIVRSRQADGRWKIYQIKSNAIDSLSITPGTVKGTGTGQFLSKATISDITNPLAPTSLGGNYQLQVTVFDNGEPGTSDTLAVALWDGSVLLFSSNWSGTPPKTVPQILAGGNLQAR